MRRILVSAGEPSGDMHAARVVRCLGALSEDLSVDAVGGPELKAAGARLVANLDRLGAMGLVEAARTLPAHALLLGRLQRAFTRGEYDLVVLVDYPGFNLPVARAASRRGIPVLYYIPPQLWAWASWRVGALRRSVAEVAVILPFEQQYFEDRGVRATFVGHPLLDGPSPPDRVRARSLLELDPSRPVLGLFPGTRSGERRMHWDSFRQAALEVKREIPEVQLVVAGTAGDGDLSGTRLRCWNGDPAYVLAAADAVLVKSGTATLEAALADVPLVIAYRMHAVSFALARRLVRVPYVGLVNLIAGEAVAPEYLQDRAEPRVLARSLVRLIADADGAAAEQRAAFRTVRNRLGAPGASRRVAELALHIAA